MNLVKGYTQLIIDRCRAYGLLRNQAAYVLATAKWETAHTMEPVVEAYWLSEAWRRENLRYYPWHGRGFVQLTWEENYRRAAQKLGVSLDEEPDLALKPDIAANVLVVGMREGWFTGVKLADYVTVNLSDFINARRVVNGTDKANKIASLARRYDKALKNAGYGATDEAEASSAAPISGKAGSIAGLIVAGLGGAAASGVPWLWIVAGAVVVAAVAGFVIWKRSE